MCNQNTKYSFESYLLNYEPVPTPVLQKYCFQNPYKLIETASVRTNYVLMDVLIK